MTKPEDHPSKQQLHIEAEKQLLPRLKWMGYLLLVFSFIAFGYAFLKEPSVIADIGEGIQEEFDAYEAIPPFNPFVMASSFIAVGSACFFCVWKKKKSHKN